MGAFYGAAYVRTEDREPVRMPLAGLARKKRSALCSVSKPDFFDQCNELQPFLLHVWNYRLLRGA